MPENEKPIFAAGFMYFRQVWERTGYLFLRVRIPTRFELQGNTFSCKKKKKEKDLWNRDNLALNKRWPA